MIDLPEELRSAVDDVIAKSGLTGGAADRVRQDLAQHFRDGLDAGRSPADLLARFGDPAAVASALAATPAPKRAMGGGDGPLAGFLMDLRHALRSLLRTPAVTVAATVVLAMGVGANGVVFTAANELLLRPLPVSEPSTLVDVWPDITGGNSFLGFAWADFLEYRDGNVGLEQLIAFAGRRLELGELEGGEAVVTQFVSPGYFEMLGLGASVGRTSFSPDARFGEPLTVVLAHRLWQESFGADPAIVGTTIRLGGHPAQVIGVGPAGFAGHFIGFPTDLWVPVTAADPLMPGFDPADRATKPFEMIGRLRPGMTPEAAASAFNRVAAELEARYPEVNRGHRVGVSPTTGVDHSLRPAVTAFVSILAVVSLLVLIIACLNVGGVLLVRAMSRNREVAIRLAIGAGRGRLLRQLMTETAVLVGLGAVLGMVVAVNLNGVLAEVIRSMTGGLGPDLTLDGRVLAMTFGAAVAAAFGASAAPALHLIRRDPAGALRGRTRGSELAGRLRIVMVTGQVAVSVVLVVATGLFGRALHAGTNADPGFDVDRLGSLELVVDPTAGDGVTVQNQVLDALRGVPGIEHVTVTDGRVLGVARSPVTLVIPGVQPPPGREGIVVDGRSVGAAYLEVTGIPLLAGRDFTEDDAREGPRVAVVTESFVRRYWPDEGADGRSFFIGSEAVRVVGVAADARYLVQDDEPDPLVYLSLAGRTEPAGLIVYRAADPLAASGAIDDVIQNLIPGHRRISVDTPRRALRDALLPQRLAAWIVGGMGLAALFLAAVGLYGLIQFTVTRDTHDLGIRLALGGSPADVLWVVLKKSFLLVLVGIVAGLGIAAVAAPALSEFLAGVSPVDPITYGAVAMTFAAVALLAGWLPARRAAAIAPTEALRSE